MDKQAQIDALTIDIINAPIKSRLFKNGEKVGKYIKKWHCEVIAEYLPELGYTRETSDIISGCGN